MQDIFKDPPDEENSRFWEEVLRLLDEFKDYELIVWGVVLVTPN